MNHNPKVSIIIPNYNHEKFLNKRIQSILNQTYDNYEIIILDDQSTDNSKKIIEKYRTNTKVSHIIYNNKNSGSTFKQWDIGLKMSKGEFIWIAESDDYCTNDMLETLITHIQKNNNISIVYCSSQPVDQNNIKLSPYIAESNEITFYSGIEFIKKRMIYGNAIWNASSALFRKKYAIKTSKEYTTFTAAGDKLFWINLAELGDIIWIHSPKNYFRQHLNKVSPQKLINGTTFTEEYKIFKYLYSKKYIDFITNLRIRKFYIEKIEQIKEMPNNVQKKQKALWTKNGFLTKTIIRCIIKFHELLICKILKYGFHHNSNIQC